MKQIFGLFALLLGVCAANAQTADTVKYAAGNDLYRGITRKLPYRQMVTPYGVEVTFAKTVHIIFPAAVRYVDLGSNHIIAGKADGAENVIRVKATTEGFPGETNFSVICEDGSFFSFNGRIVLPPQRQATIALTMGGIVKKASLLLLSFGQLKSFSERMF